MNIWLVNPFDPLPGDVEQPGRYATLAGMLAERGHKLTWWTSSFSHRFKRPVGQQAVLDGCREVGIEPAFLPSPPYQRNVSLARLRNHRVLAQAFRAMAPAHAPPDVVVASSPPPGLALEAMKLAALGRARAVLDVQDLWPDTFERLLPWPVRPLAKAALRPMHRQFRQAARLADAIVGVADEYATAARDRSGRSDQQVLTIPIGIDLEGFDTAAQGKASADQHCQFTKAPGQIWLVYSGSLSRSYDCLTIIRAAAILKDRGDLRFFITGRGELELRARGLIRQQGLSNVTLTGFMEFGPWARLLRTCDIGFNAAFPEAKIFLPNKVFYYFAAGLAVFNTVPGQCSEIISRGSCGLDYRAGDAQSCAAAIRALVDDPAKLQAMRSASRRLAAEVYDREILYTRYMNLIDRLGGAMTA